MYEYKNYKLININIMTSNNFLPAEAKEPKGKSNYTKLTEGVHKLRVMSSAIVGYEEWQTDGEKKVPVRYTTDNAPPFGKDGKELNYFWAFLVYNYEQERLQIMEVTQKTIRTALQAYIDNEAWGSPQSYDIVITRKGTKLDDTEYHVVANPHSEAPVVDIEGVSLEAWMKGEEPFVKKEE
jgi:hypothetical protein